MSQDIQSEKDRIESFNLEYKLELDPLPEFNFEASNTANIQTPTQNFFSIKDKKIYAEVSGYKLNISETLSWGRVMLVVKEENTPTVDKIVKPRSKLTPQELKEMAQKEAAKYTTFSYDENGIEVKKANYKQTFFKFDAKRNLWKISSHKIERGYPYYFVKIFTDKNNYAFKVIEEKQTSGNSIVKLESFSDYNSFLAVLFLMDSATKKGDDSDSISLAELSKYFPITFFNTLNYQIPLNTIKKFDAKKPIFLFDRAFEAELLKLAALFKTDKEEALHYLKKGKEPLLSEASRLNLLKHFQELQ